MSSSTLRLAQALVAGFLAVLFLQSGLDKVLDWKGNKDYTAKYFEKSPLRRFSTLLLFFLTIQEVLAGVASAAGAMSIVMLRDAKLALVGAGLSALSLLSVFFGQRLSKDYAGASGTVPYFTLVIVGVALFGWRN